MCAECLRCLERSFHMQDEIKLQVKKETLHVKIFIYKIFLTVILVYIYIFYPILQHFSDNIRKIENMVDLGAIN